MREHAKRGTSKLETSLTGPCRNGTVKRFAKPVPALVRKGKFTPLLFIFLVFSCGLPRNHVYCSNEFPCLEEHRKIYQSLSCHRRNRGFPVIWLLSAQFAACFSTRLASSFANAWIKIELTSPRRPTKDTGTLTHLHLAGESLGISSDSATPMT